MRAIYGAPPPPAHDRQPIPAAQPVQPPEPAPVLAKPLGPAFAVHVLGSTGPRYIAWFCHEDQARRWAEREYPSRYILDRCDLASYDPDDATPPDVPTRMVAAARDLGVHVMLTAYPDGVWEADAGDRSSPTPGPSASEALDRALAIEDESRCLSVCGGERCLKARGHDRRHANGGEWWETDAEGKITMAGGPGRGVGAQWVTPTVLVASVGSRVQPVVTPADLGLSELAQTEVAEALAKPSACPEAAPAASPQAEPSPEAHEAALAQARAEGRAQGMAEAQDEAAIELRMVRQAADDAALDKLDGARREGYARGKDHGYQEGIRAARTHLEGMVRYQRDRAAYARSEAESHDRTGGTLELAVAWLESGGKEPTP